MSRTSNYYHSTSYLLSFLILKRQGHGISVWSHANSPKNKHILSSLMGYISNLQRKNVQHYIQERYNMCVRAYYYFEHRGPYLG